MEKFDVIKTLVEEYRASIIRTRQILIIINVISVIFLVGYFNHRFTWLRHIGTLPVAEKVEKDSRPSTYLEFQNPGKGNIIDVREELVKNKIGGDFMFVDINVIGTKIFIDDLPLLGGVALLIVMTWFQYAIRRERGIVCRIKAKAKGESSKHIVEYLFYSTSFRSIFNTIDGIDKPNIDGFRDKYNSKLLKAVKILLVFAPAILLSFIVIHDVIETFLLPNILLCSGDISLFLYLIKEEKIGQIVEIGIRLLMAILLINYSIRRTIRVIQINKEIETSMVKVSEYYIQLNGGKL